MSQAPAWSDIAQVNHEKAWQLLRRLGREHLLMLFARTLRFVPVTRLEQIFGDHAHPDEIGDTQRAERQPLVDAVREFVGAALAGAFYEDFRVNSHNYTDKSGGTQTFEAQLDLLFDRCVEEARDAQPAEVVTAYELLFELLREIDRFERDDIVFFADEGGVWQFNLNWKWILPPYVACLAKVADREQFERRVEAVIDEFADQWQQGEIRQSLADEQRSRGH